ncbi:MAG TPA: hypothetical protein VJ860_10220 [Polyangia bacterium]|jgi:hypothetical protein|nr:hypothetical protein [Polyangia bacterium]
MSKPGIAVSAIAGQRFCVIVYTSNDYAPKTQEENYMKPLSGMIVLVFRCVLLASCGPSTVSEYIRKNDWKGAESHCASQPGEAQTECFCRLGWALHWEDRTEAAAAYFARAMNSKKDGYREEADTLLGLFRRGPCSPDVAEYQVDPLVLYRVDRGGTPRRLQLAEQFYGKSGLSPGEAAHWMATVLQLDRAESVNWQFLRCSPSVCGIHGLLSHHFRVGDQDARRDTTDILESRSFSAEVDDVETIVKDLSYKGVQALTDRVMLECGYRQRAGEENSQGKYCSKLTSYFSKLADKAAMHVKNCRDLARDLESVPGAEDTLRHKCAGVPKD